jgi:hypothetical protein
MKSVEQQLTLYPPSNVIDEDKKKTLKNLYESGMDRNPLQIRNQKASEINYFITSDRSHS